MSAFSTVVSVILNALSSAFQVVTSNPLFLALLILGLVSTVTSVAFAIFRKRRG